MTDGSVNNICIGGTFSPLHRGHRRLLKDAFFNGKHVMVGLTSDEMAAKDRTRQVDSYQKRFHVLVHYLARLSSEYGKTYEIRMIDDPIGFADDPSVDSIVVSAETERTVEEIDRRRRERSLPPIRVFKVDMVLDIWGRRISSTRISDGEIDRDGGIVSGKDDGGVDGS